MDKIGQIKKAIADAVDNRSQLDAGPLSVGGFTSIKIRHLLNNLAKQSIAYFEVGSHIGATYISAVYKNEPELCGGYYACDNFSEFNRDGNTKQRFLENCEKHLVSHYLMDIDCWDITKIHEVRHTDLYLYDGAHDYESQKKAVTHFAPLMADEFVMLVDDASWEQVRRGTMDGIREAGLEVLYEQTLWNGVESDADWWWNGIMVLLLKRK